MAVPGTRWWSDAGVELEALGGLVGGGEAPGLPDAARPRPAAPAASIWLGQGADPKVVQAVLGHATATMTMDLYGHLVASNLWDSAQRIGGTTRARTASVTGLGPATTSPQVVDLG